MRYHLTDEHFETRSWGGDEFLIYLPRSHQTLVLDAISTHLLIELKNGPLQAAELLDGVNLAVGNNEDEMAHRVEASIGHLRLIGVIEAAPA